MQRLALALCLPAALAAAGRADNPLEQFTGLWTREENTGALALDRARRRRGRPTVRIEHSGKRDWSLTSKRAIDVAGGDLFELSAAVKLTGPGRAELSVITYGAEGKVVRWNHGWRRTTATDWRELRARFVVPRGVRRILPRLTGQEPATVWLDGFQCRKVGRIPGMDEQADRAPVRISNKTLAVAFDPDAGTFAVTDRRTGRTWRQRAVAVPAVAAVRSDDERAMTISLVDTSTALEFRAVATLEPDAPELVVELSGEGAVREEIAFPAPFVTAEGTTLVVPMNEGIGYPVEDESVRPLRLAAYGGHGICMAFWGATDGEAGYQAILETPDDALLRVDRVDGLLAGRLCWEAQRGKFGGPRRVRYCFHDAGGHVAMCKRYRRHVRDAGKLVTLADKRKRVPAVDRLVGAVNVWCWDKQAVQIVREMRDAGIERILWSHRLKPDALRALNEMPGVLTSRYDIYQDVMDPANFDRLRWVHGDWTTPAWPDDLMLDARGDWVRGWKVRAKDGTMIPCGVLCDRQALPYAEKRVAEELKTHPYRCRFIDTTTASPWRECHHPKHPMTRSDSRHWKMELLRLMSERFKLVTGSETGHDAAVPFVHYFEGMLSLGPYRVPDAGRDMMRIWEDVPERVAKFQLGHRYRLPLWELVYHDCVVAQWYWGDYNNKLPGLWDKRDLFNALYGTPPMFMFDARRWRENKDRFVRSYRATGPVARATGYHEMTDHRFLTPDRDVQQTRFANGVTVTVNFGDEPYEHGGTTVRPHGANVEGLGGAE